MWKEKTKKTSLNNFFWSSSKVRFLLFFPRCNKAKKPSYYSHTIRLSSCLSLWFRTPRNKRERERRTEHINCCKRKNFTCWASPLNLLKYDNLNGASYAVVQRDKTTEKLEIVRYTHIWCIGWILRRQIGLINDLFDSNEKKKLCWHIINDELLWKYLIYNLLIGRY